MLRLIPLRVLILPLLLAALGFSTVAAGSGRSDADLPDKYRQPPYTQMSLSVGSPIDGWQLRAKRLRASSNLSIKAGSGGRTYGHPALVLMLERSARQLGRQVPGARLLIGDLSRESGGPLSGHRSHESGRDADVGFMVLNSAGRPVTLNRFVAFDADGKARDGSAYVFDDYGNWLLVQLWLKDDRADIQHVFVASHLRQRLLAFARARPALRKYVDQAAALLHEPRNAADHDDHFHVRIRCPEDQRGLCVEHVAVSD
ncbi:MAG TPA: penicillin-insensitive murein endopeptidase [Polyangiaceae bacterium]